ncbi:VanZ family protein [Aeromicrobium duanguangcaii]|uniref:VanZ family protein n=1 Tax=Aeromicrobium duanguangcaii TaxID=2968086 RepID=A0ABY5KDP3_9ACTN|nr:VanZ family protein [Aeromicrobium duanguangcaii]MCD9154530.1 VanZ family protein [Aeromicrobium duanguangcaii]UUI68414.1 VanZ family protein [Aeromicrobium duanguangcaii]
MQPEPRPYGIAAGIAGAYAVLLALIGWWPRHVDSGLGLVDQPVVHSLADALSVPPGHVVAAGEVMANVVLFVPIGLFLALGWRRASIGVAAAVALAVSVGIEVVQWLAPIDRTASAVDVVVNVAGGCLGFAAVRAVRGRPRAQRWVVGGLAVIVLLVAAVLVRGLTVS